MLTISIGQQVICSIDLKAHEAGGGSGVGGVNDDCSVQSLVLNCFGTKGRAVS